MYEELIKTAKICCGDVPTEECAAVCINPHDKRGEDVRFCRQWLIKDLYTALAALQTENEEKDREIERLKSELLEAREDYMASGMEREQGVDTLSRVEAERDAAQKEIERMKGIMRQHGIMVIPSKYPGGRPEWNISRGAQGEG